MRRLTNRLLILLALALLALGAAAQFALFTLPFPRSSSLLEARYWGCCS